MKNELTIIVAGVANCGKSSMVIQLDKLLKENGFNVEISFNEPYSEEKEYYFRQKHLEENSKKIQHFKTNTKITLKEMQLKRDCTKNNETQTKTDNDN